MTSGANWFHLLAACCREPGKTLRKGRIFEQLAESTESTGAQLAVGRMAHALRVTPPGELRAEYSRLFVGPDKLPAPPCASVYIDPGRQVMGETTVTVEHAYQAAGLQVAPHEPADHIAQLLEFAYHLELSGEEAEPFVERFIRPWAKEFCRKVRAETRYAYFAVLAECLESFLYPRTH